MSPSLTWIYSYFRSCSLPTQISLFWGEPTVAPATPSIPCVFGTVVYLGQDTVYLDVTSMLLCHYSVGCFFFVWPMIYLLKLMVQNYGPMVHKSLHTGLEQLE